MEKINTASELRIAIQQLELKQHEDIVNIKEQINRTYESLNPVNILKNTLNEITSSSCLLENILSSSMALVSGYFSKKIVVGSSESPVRKMLGAIVQYGITNLVVKHTEDIKSFGQFMVQYFLQKSKPESEEE